MCSPLNDSFLICLDGLSDELSDMELIYAMKETKINSLENQIEFVVTRVF